MSRSGYDYDCENDWELICWRGAVASAIRGKRGQALLREMLVALDAIETRRLITGDLVRDGEVCALGAVGVARGLELRDVDPHDRDTVAGVFNIAPALAAEIMYVNDEEINSRVSPESRWHEMRRWVEGQIKR